jgi:D-aminopeptidase
LSTERPRARDLGIRIGPLPPGPFNAITDVPGVRVGHVTLNYGDGPLRIGHGPVRTGVTAVLPPGDDWYFHPVEAGNFVFNGAGTTVGLSLIDEFGRIETPVMLTNTLSVGAVYEGVVRSMVETTFAPRGAVPWFNPVVGETSDAFSTTYRAPETMAKARESLAAHESVIDGVFQAVADATEEAILNSMFRAHTVVGYDAHTREALPLDAVLERLRRAGRI